MLTIPGIGLSMVARLARLCSSAMAWGDAQRISRTSDGVFPLTGGAVGIAVLPVLKGTLNRDVPPGLLQEFFGLCWPVA